MLPFRFPEELRGFPYRRRPPFPLSGHLDEVRAAEMQGMLAEPAADFIHGFIEAAHFVRPHGVVEQGVLNGEIGAHLHEHHPGCPVIYPPSGRG